MQRGSILIPILLLTLTATVILIGSCTKNNSGKPSFSLVSISKTVLAQDSMRATFKFTNGGSVSNNNLWWIRTRLNVNPPLNAPSGADTFGYQLPSFTGQTGNIYLSLPWNGYLSTGSGFNDTLMFRFYLTNAADSAISDTVTVPQIVVNFQ